MVKVKSPYLRLNIIREKLDDAIEDFFLLRDEVCTYDKIYKVNGDRHRLKFTVNGKDELLDFRFNQDGSTSIDLSAGGKSDFKVELADNLRVSPICTYEGIREFKSPYFVFENMKQDDVETTLEIILDNESVFLEKKLEVAGGNRWVLKSKEGESVTASYYFKSKKTMIQGKPLKLFSEVYTSLMMLLDIEEMPKVMEQNLEISTEMQKEEVIEALKIHIPDAFPHINSKLKKLLYQCVFNLRIQMEMFEYSFLAFPALKSLEGHLKYIMKENSISLIDKKFSMFDKEGNGKYVLRSEFEKDFSPSQLAAISDAYTFYQRNRHSIFHWAEVDGAIPLDRTRMIDNITEAHSIIMNVFGIMNNYYK
ncbi:type II toxin-antitoxin system RnlA family toxin [Cytobacillus kochii]